MYTILYIDNGAVTGTAEELKWAYEVLPGIFGPYQFELQQFMTDVPIIQAQADEASGDQTPDSVKLLGLQCDRISDKISAPTINLCGSCNTKQKILKSIAGRYMICLILMGLC